MRVLLIIGIVIGLVSCAISPSKPKSLTSKLSKNQGAIIFSTIGEEQSSQYGGGFVNIANEVIGLGLASETRIFQIAPCVRIVVAFFENQPQRAWSYE